MPFVVADYELGFEDNKYRINCYEGDTDCSGQVMYSPKCQRKTSRDKSEVWDFFIQEESQSAANCQNKQRKNRNAAACQR